MSIPVDLPPLAEQRRIAARLKTLLTSVEVARQAARTQLKEIELLSQRILSQAFTN